MLVVKTTLDHWLGLGVLSFKIAFLWDDWSEKLREGEFFSLLIDWSFWVKPIVSFDLLYCRKKVFHKKDYTSYLHQTMIERSVQFADGGNSNHIKQITNNTHHLWPLWSVDLYTSLYTSNIHHIYILNNKKHKPRTFHLILAVQYTRKSPISL